MNFIRSYLFVVLFLFGQITVAQTHDDFIAQGYKPWAWTESNCQKCELVLHSSKAELQTQKVQAFIRALEASKFEILGLYHSSPQEYNLLAQMAVGILGRESQFFESRRYRFKESFPWAVSLVKTIQIYLDGSESAASANSRGPTQIKVVPQIIAETYQIEPENLYIPENAAKATIGFLIEALQELKQRARNNRWEFVTKKTYVDYLPYIYFGATHHLKNRTATPETNIYIQDMKKYMSWLETYERQIPETQQLP